jgi:glycosyltransferase involved in cell wall biosynthesis
MKISILLPYKENYSPIYAGAVSIFVNSTCKISRFKKNITVFGSTDYTKFLSSNYQNIELKKNFLFSQSKNYVEKFLNIQRINKPDIIEVHNRPIYVNDLSVLNTSIVLYFHNDPLSMLGSKTADERISLLNKCEKIIFNSEWSKKQFLLNLDSFYYKSLKLEVIHQSTNKVKINFKKKEKVIIFAGKLNSAKGYDIFASAITKILNKYKNWKSIVIGDEPREKIKLFHKNLTKLGFLSHSKVLDVFKKSSIAVACSRWEEPFGRTSLEASSRGCAVIISNRGGLPETITNGIILRKLNSKELFKSIENLILNKENLKKLQIQAYKNFFLTDNYSSKKIDSYRDNLLKNLKINININIRKSNSNLKILHVTNFNERHDGRLFYNTGRRINNGFIRLNHSVLEFSDRDVISYYRNLSDLNGSKKLNNKLLSVISNYLPDLIVLGHADLIKIETLKFIKKNYPNIKIVQWFLDRMDSYWISNRKRFLDKIDFMDVSFCTSDPATLKFNNKNKIYYIPNPVDESFETLENYKNKFFSNDVFFAMSHGVHRGILKKGKFDEREIFINKLIDMTPNIRFDLYGMKNVQPIWADNFINAISKSKIGLNLSQGIASKYYSSDRFSQLIGNGLLVMIDKKTMMSDFFNNNEIVEYSNLSDLSEKIIKYSSDNKLRNKIAKNGRYKYFKYFNSKIIAQFIIDKTFDVKKKYIWDKLR